MPPKRGRKRKAAVDSVPVESAPVTRRSRRTQAASGRAEPSSALNAAPRTKQSRRTQTVAESSEPLKGQSKNTKESAPCQTEPDVVTPEVPGVSKEEIIERIRKAWEKKDPDAITAAFTATTAKIKTEALSDVFFAAVEARECACVEALIAGNLTSNPNLLLKEGQHALRIATTNKQTDMVKALTSKKFATKSVRTGGGETPLHIASSNGDLEMVDALLSCGFDPNSGFHLGRYPLHTACKDGYTRIAERLLAAGAKPGTPQGYMKETPLMLAAGYGHEEIVRMLLKRKIQINARDLVSETALMKAVIGDHVSVTRMLIEAGANPDVKGLTPDPDAPHHEEYGDKPLFIAIEHGSEEMIKLLLDTGRVNVDYVCDHYSNLHMAISLGNMEVIRLLLDAGADPSKCNRSRMNVWHHFGDSWPDKDPSKTEELFTLLLAQNLPMEAMNAVDTYMGYTPLMYAVRKDNPTLVKCLLRENCDVNIQRYYELSPANTPTALQIALEYSKGDIARLLMDAGCDLECIRKLHHSANPPKYLSEDASWLISILDNVRPLKNLCSINIRKMLGTPLKNKLDQLELPTSLSKELCFQ